MDEPVITAAAVQHQPVVGGFYMKNNGLVRIDGTVGDRFSIQYIQIVNGQVSSGGGSSSWAASDFTPINDPRMYAAAQVFLAQCEAHDHRVLGSRAENRAQHWLFAMEAITEASKATGSAT